MLQSGDNLGVVGREKQEKGHSSQRLCGGDLTMSLSLPPLFVPILLVPFCICLGGSWSVLLIDSIFLWHLSSDWLKDFEGEKL